jgi:glycosyltransferase involved in cell wall biosynthesis
MRERLRARWIERVAIRDVSAMTAVSVATAEEYRDILCWRRPVEVIPNAVPPVLRRDTLRQAARDKLGLPAAEFVFVAVGNIKPEKGYEDLLDASRLREEMAPRLSTTVLIAGNQDDGNYWRAICDQHRRLGLDHRVRFLGYQADVPALYAAADAFVLSSRKEGLPMVLLEAMAAGLPVVATSVGGVPSVVRHEQTGLLVSPGAPQELATAMVRLQEEEELRSRMAANGRDRIEQQFSLEDMVGSYLKVFESVL